MTRPIKKQGIYISTSPDLRATADSLALSIYYSSVHHTTFSGVAFRPQRGGIAPLTMSESLPELYRQSVEQADLLFYLYDSSLDEGCVQRFHYAYERGQEDEAAGKRLFLFAPLNDDGEALANFRDTQDKKHGNFCAYFDNDSHLKYLVSEQLWIALGKQLHDRELEHDAMTVTLENGLQLRLADLPFIQGNSSYVDKARRLEELLSRKDELIQDCEENPEQRKYKQRLSDVNAKIVSVKKEIDKELDLVFQRSLQLASYRRTVSSTRLKRALKEFDEGRISRALEWLEDAEERTEQSMEMVDQAIDTLKGNIGELRVKIQLINADGRLSIATRVDQAYDIYQLLFKALKRVGDKVALAEEYFNCGVLCQKMNRHQFAIEHYECSLALHEKLAIQQPDVYEPDLALVLMNLGNSYRSTQRHREAQVTYERSLVLLKKLASQQPNIYESDLASVLSGLGILYSDRRCYREALKAFLRSLRLREKLASQQPKVHEADLASVLMNLGNLYYSTRRTHRYKKAQKAFLCSLRLCKKLVRHQPDIYESMLATAFMNLGILYTDMQRHRDAEDGFKRSLALREKLAREQPDVYEPDLAKVLMNLGVLYYSTQWNHKAELAYKRSLALLEKLASQQPDVYEPDLATVLMNLGGLYVDMNKFVEAGELLKRRHTIYSRLELKNPDVYRKDLEEVMHNMEVLH